MNAASLQSLLQSSQPPLLVHVLPEEVFAAKRITGSANACIYEVAFLSKVAALTPDRHRPIVVYGAGGGSHDARVAKEKLVADGYTSVEAFEGGLDEWARAGLPIESDGELPSAAVQNGTFVANTGQSVIRWTGRNLFNDHRGTVRLASGTIVLAEGALRSAEFTIDMRSIACDDLTDADVNAMLIRHLESDDFFDVAKYPTATFSAERAEPIAKATEGTANYLLHGRFTLRGVTKPLDFPIVVASADGNRITGQAQFEIDRTEFGSHYGSGRFFRFLCKHVVNDHIHLHVKLHADRAGAA